MWKLMKAMRSLSVHGLETRRRMRFSEFKNLPPDLWLEVLARLPVKTLLKLRCVCKSWCSIIDSPDFIHMHFTLYKNNLQRNRLLTFEIVPNPVSKLKIYSSISFNKIDELLENSGNFYFVGSCNGLLLQGSGSKFRLLNPSINKSRILPPPPIDCLCSVNYVLGFKPSCNDYKVVAFSRNFEKITIYSFRDHSWRIKSDINMVHCSHFRESLDIRSVVFLEKAAYWFEGGNPSYTHLVSFDFEAEEFSVSDLPDSEKKMSAQFIFILGDSIAVLSMCLESSNVWTLEKEGAKEAWRLYFCGDTNLYALKLIEGAMDLSSVILYVEHSDTVMMALDGKVIYYKLSNHQVKLLRESFHDRLVVVTYVENLVLHKRARWIVAS